MIYYTAAMESVSTRWPIRTRWWSLSCFEKGKEIFFKIYYFEISFHLTGSRSILNEYLRYKYEKLPQAFVATFLQFIFPLENETFNYSLNVMPKPIITHMNTMHTFN